MSNNRQHKTKQETLCPHRKKCGGCQLQNLSYEEQLHLKMAKVIKLLGRFHRVEEIIGMEYPYHYRNKVQAYFYNELHWFYDLRDIFAQAGASLTELAQLDAALDECVLYKDATPTFFGLKLLRVCGLSSYIPMPERESLNDYYKTLSWNKATGLIQ